MDVLLKKILEAPGIPGYEGEIAKIIYAELKKSCTDVLINIGFSDDQCTRLWISCYQSSDLCCSRCGRVDDCNS